MYLFPAIEEMGCVTAGFGRALEWHSRGQRFDPAYLHQNVPKGKAKACFRKKTGLLLYYIDEVLG